MELTIGLGLDLLPDHYGTRSDLIAEHSPEAIRRRLRRGPRHSHLRDFLYGAIDGVVTTFAVGSGVAGADLSSGIVVVLGLAKLIADGFSMAARNYLGVKSEREKRERIRRLEEHHIESYPEGEREEIRQLFQAKGFAGPGPDRAVDVITEGQRCWGDMMTREEYGLPLEGPKPWHSAWTTFAAFVVVGFVPVAPFVGQVAISAPLPLECWRNCDRVRRGWRDQESVRRT